VDADDREERSRHRRPHAGASEPVDRQLEAAANARLRDHEHQRLPPHEQRDPDTRQQPEVPADDESRDHEQAIDQRIHQRAEALYCPVTLAAIPSA